MEQAVHDPLAAEISHLLRLGVLSTSAGTLAPETRQRLYRPTAEANGSRSNPTPDFSDDVSRSVISFT